MHIHIVGVFVCGENFGPLCWPPQRGHSKSTYQLSCPGQLSSTERELSMPKSLPKPKSRH